MMPQKEIRKQLIWTVPSGAFREDFVYLIYKWKCDSARNGNLRGWAGLRELVLQKYEFKYKFKVRQIQLNMYPVKGLEKTDGVWEGFHCGIVKLRNQETKMCLFAVQPTGPCVSNTVFRTQCIASQCLQTQLTWLEPLLTLGCAT